VERVSRNRFWKRVGSASGAPRVTEGMERVVHSLKHLEGGVNVVRRGGQKPGSGSGGVVVIASRFLREMRNWIPRERIRRRDGMNIRCSKVTQLCFQPPWCNNRCSRRDVSWIMRCNPTGSIFPFLVSVGLRSHLMRDSGDISTYEICITIHDSILLKAAGEDLPEITIWSRLQESLSLDLDAHLCKRHLCYGPYATMARL
jgi:hypothetical protein